MKCKIIYGRDPNTAKIDYDKVQAVKAPNGNRSLLFDAIRNDIKDDKKALNQYFKVYTDTFKKEFGRWEDIHTLDESVKGKLDENGEPKYIEVENLFTADEVIDEGQVNVFEGGEAPTSYEKELGENLEAKMKELYPEIKLEYTNEVITPDNDSLYQHDTVESKPLTFDEIEDISNYIVKLDSVSERAYKPRTNTIEIETKNPIYNERRHDVIDDVFKTSPDSINKLNINVKLISKVLPFKGKDLTVNFNNDRIEFLNKKGNVISVVKNLSKVEKENIKEYLETNDDSVDSFIKGYFNFIQDKYDYYIVLTSQARLTHERTIKKVFQPIC